ncbi:MAG: OadG family protein [Dehalococcoidia bacterium]
MLAEAGEIAGIGFGMVFLILIILALVMWGAGAAIQRIEKGDQSEDQSK